MQGRPLVGEGVCRSGGSRGCGPPPAAGSEPSLPGPGPTRTLQTLTDPGGTEGWAPSRPEDRIDKGEMLRRWAAWLGRGERAVHRAPSPASCGGPQLIPNRGLPGGARRKDRWKRRGRAGRGGRGKEKMEEGRGETAVRILPDLVFRPFLVF